jgi:two-component system nitrate/nitrite response regulator NarL
LECIVVLSESVGRDEEGLLQAGANACIASSVSPDVFVMSLNLLLAKEIAMAALTDRLNSAFTAVDTHQPSRPLSLGDLGSAGTRGLTRRELDVLQAVARGESNKRIANRLSMREPTVKSHMRVILKKIGSNNRTQAATWAVSHGLADQAAAHLPGSETSLNGYSRQDGSYLNTA